MDLFKIGDKTISRGQIDRWINRILALRSEGLSQQEVGQKLKIDRTFISRLESLGELRKGRNIAVVGFPIANIAQLTEICQRHGVNWYLFLSEAQRLNFVGSKSGLQLFNDTMELLAKARSFDTVMILGSTKRIQIIEALLDREAVRFPIGESPLTQDVHVDTHKFEEIIIALCGKEE
jgi:hypothetical protein